MELLGLITICALSANPVVHDELYQLATFNDVSVLRVDDFSSSKVYDANSSEEASGIASALLEAGHDIRVGLVQIPATKISRYEISLASSFDPCANIAIASDILDEGHQKFGKNSPKALAWYMFGKNFDTSAVKWARHVRTLDIPERRTQLDDESGPQPRVHLARPELFVERLPAQLKSDTRIFVSAPKIKAAPSEISDKPRPVESKQMPAHTPSGIPGATQISSRTKAKKKTKKAQPDVTTERLQTTKELKKLSETNPAE